MPNPWFRMYSEFADDPKVQMMSEVDQRRLVMLFCEQCKEVKHDETLRAFYWRITPLEVAATRDLFVKNGFIDENWNVLNWNKRQYISDSSTERVRRFRQAKKQNETLQPPSCNGAEQNRADTEQNQKQQKPYPPTPDGAADLLPKAKMTEDEKSAVKAAEKELKIQERATVKALKEAAEAMAKEHIKKLQEANRLAKKKSAPPTKTEYVKSRHAEFKVAIFEYWKSKNPNIDCPWNQTEGVQLESWLQSSPNTTVLQFKEMLRNRYRSEAVVHSERPSLWIKNITSYANGPLNTFRQPLNSGGGKTNGKSADRAFATAANVIQEIEDSHGTHAGELLSGSGAN
jgi:hypothetical protein